MSEWRVCIVGSALVLSATTALSLSLTLLPRGLDCNYYNQPGLYNPDAYRSADHDPVIVGLRLGAWRRRSAPGQRDHPNFLIIGDLNAYAIEYPITEPRTRATPIWLRLVLAQEHSG